MLWPNNAYLMAKHVGEAQTMPLDVQNQEYALIVLNVSNELVILPHQWGGLLISSRSQ